MQIILKDHGKLQIISIANENFQRFNYGRCMKLIINWNNYLVLLIYDVLIVLTYEKQHPTPLYM